MKIGFIGYGNMGGALMNGMLRAGFVKPEDVYVSNPHLEKLEDISRKGVHCTTDNAETAKQADMLFLTVKPQYYASVIEEIRDVVDAEMVIITVAPGWSLQRLTDAFGRELQIIRTMPNTPALVGEGNIVVSPGEAVKADMLELALSALRCCGKAEIIPENLQNAAVAVSGSSPAYVFIMIEAMADAAVADGMPRKLAYQFAAQAVYGSAKMVLESGRHPADLKDMVCSPAGTTIEAVKALERCGFRNSIMEAMKACTDKTKGM